MMCTRQTSCKDNSEFVRNFYDLIGSQNQDQILTVKKYENLARFSVQRKWLC